MNYQTAAAPQLAGSPGNGNGPMLQNGRDKISWSKEIWDYIDMAVHDECNRTRVATSFVPIQQVAPHTTTVPADSVSAPAEEAGVIGAFAVDEGEVKPLVELSVGFLLTQQQAEQESLITNGYRGHSTAVTLATRAANLLARAEDMVIFQGQAAFATDFFQKNIRSRGVPSDFGLLDIIPPGASSSVPALPADQVITVERSDPTSAVPVYGENTFKAVAEAYAVLQDKGHNGPYAVVLDTKPFADSYSPLAGTLIVPADRIKALATAGFYGSGTLAAATTAGAEPQFTGSMVSVGGNTVDLVVGTDATTEFMQQDVDGNYRFRVKTDFTLRLKALSQNESAFVRFEFQ